MTRRVTGVLLLFLLCLPGMGQVRSSEVHRLTIDDALRLALRNNHELAAARIDVEKAEALVSEAWGNTLPKIDLSARYTRSLKLPVFFLPDFDDPNSGKVVPIKVGSENSIDLSLTATQILFNSAVFIGVGTAKTYSETAREMFRAKQLETITNVRRAFYGGLLAREVRSMMHATLANAEQNYRNVSALADQGILAEYDRLRAEVALENLRPEVMKSDNDYRLAMNGLKQAIGAPFADSLDIDGLFAAPPVDPVLLETAVATVIEVNPALSALRHQADVNDAIISVERSNALPTLAAFGNYQYQAQKSNLRISTNDLIGSSAVGINLSLNIFNGFSTNARIEQATLDLRRTETRIAGMETSLKTQVESIVLNVRWARERITGQEKTVAQAEKGYRIAAARFASGAGTQLDVNDAQLAVNRATVNRLQAIYDYLIATAELDQALGRFPASVQNSD